MDLSDGAAPAPGGETTAQPAADPAPAPEAAAAPAPQPASAPVQGAPASEAKPETAEQAGLQSMLGDKPATEEAAPESGDAAELAEEAFAVEIPEGFVADTEGVGVLEAKVKDGSLSKEAAQELAKVHMEGIRRYEASLVANAQKQVESWEAEIKAHPQYGGVKLTESVDNAKLVLHKYATPEMRKIFNDVGVLSHPDFFVMLNKIHAATSDGVSLGGAGQATPETNPAKVLFPDFK